MLAPGGEWPFVDYFAKREDAHYPWRRYRERIVAEASMVGFSV